MNIKFCRYPLYVGLLLSLIFIGIACNEISEIQIVEKNEVSLDFESELLEKARTYLPALRTYTIETKVEKMRVELGRKLFHEKRLSRDKTFSCATCHDLSTYGVDGNPTSRGVLGKLGTRNTPTVLNASLHIGQFWDGRKPSLEEQAGDPILNETILSANEILPKGR